MKLSRSNAWQLGGLAGRGYDVSATQSRETGQPAFLNDQNYPDHRGYHHTNKIMAFDVVDAPYDTYDPAALSIPYTLTGVDVMALTEQASTKTRTIRVVDHDDPMDADPTTSDGSSL